MSVHRTDYDLLRRLGSRIAALRTTAGLTQAELAEKVGEGVEPVSVSRWETGARSPSITVLYRIAQALGVGVGDLVDGDGVDISSSDVALERVLARATDEQRDLLTRIAVEVVKG